MNFLSSFSRLSTIAIVLASALSISSCAAAPATAPVNAGQTALPASTSPTNTNNAAWLGHAYVTTTSVIATVPKVCEFMRDHKVTYWFVNLGLHDKTGKFSKGEAAVPQVKAFLAAVDKWETANNHRFKILGWLNGSMDEASPRYIDLSQESVRREMLKESRQFIDPNIEGSYVGGAARMFDGIQYDLEPSGADEKRFTNLITFMRELRAAIGPDRLTSFTPHKWAETGRYQWSAEFFYRMAPEIDLLCAMTYDIGLKEESAYREWMAKQTTTILRAVSGQHWNNDAAHPAPQKAAKVFIGFPGFPENKWHDKSVETMSAAISGTKAGWKELVEAKDPSTRHLEGAAIYLYTDGTGKDGYSSQAQWATFRRDWLGQE
jgi:hypothetical protein